MHNNDNEIKVSCIYSTISLGEGVEVFEFLGERREKILACLIYFKKGFGLQIMFSFSALQWFKLYSSGQTSVLKELQFAF